MLPSTEPFQVAQGIQLPNIFIPMNIYLFKDTFCLLLIAQDAQSTVLRNISICGGNE